MFAFEKFVQRLIFYNGDPWLDFELEHITKFALYLKQEKLELPEEYKSSFYFNLVSVKKKFSEIY
jgi:hypothetical protein